MVGARPMPLEAATPSDTNAADGKEVHRAGSADVERRAAGAVGLSIVGFVAVVVSGLLPRPVRSWAEIGIVWIWGLAGLVFGAALARRLIRHVRLSWSWTRLSRGHSQWRAGWSTVAGWPRLIAELMAERPAMWPFLMVSGPVSAMIMVGRLSVTVWAWSILGSVVVGMLIEFGLGARLVVRALNRYVSLGYLTLWTVLWIVFGVALAYGLHWPAPSDRGYFVAAAQINATLLVAAAVITAAPAPWQTSTRVHLAWIFTAPTVAVIGLGAAIGGSISRRDTEALFALSVSPVAPIVMAIMVGAYEQVVRRRDVAPGA
jgi:hypothetical protein